MNNPPLAQLAEATVLRTVQSEFESLKGDHPLYIPPIWTIYGPYLRDDSRLHIIAYNGTDRITISYPKFIYECFLRRLLEDYETIDHEDNNLNNNLLSNFSILTRTENILKARNRAKTIEIICKRCGKKAIKSLRDVLGNKKKGRAGPFCSRHCAGRYRHTY